MALSKRQREMLREKRTDRNKEWAEKSGSFDNKCVKLPKDKHFFSLSKPGLYRLDIIPYFVGKGNPDADEGHLHYLRVYWRHNGLGADGKQSYCCMRKTFRKPCYVCDYLDKHGSTMDEKLRKALKPKERFLWNVIDLDDKGKGVQVFDNAPYKGLGDAIKTLIQSNPKFADFDSVTDGFTIRLVVKEVSIGEGKMKEITRADGEERNKQYPEEIVEEAVCLDDCLLPASYEELRRAMGHDADAPEPEDEKAAAEEKEESSSHHKEEKEETTAPRERERASKRVTHDEPQEREEDDDEIELGDSVVHRRYGPCTVIKVFKDGRLNLEDSDGEVHTEVPPSSVVKAEEDEPQRRR